MKTITFLILVFMVTVFNTFSQTAPPIETGVSQNLAKWRAASYSDVRYKLNLTLEKMSPTLKGTIEINVKLKAENGKLNPNEAQIILDWRKIRGKEDLSTVSNVSVNGKPVVPSSDFSQLASADAKSSKVGTQNFYEINEHLVFKDSVKIGENIIKLDFTSPILTGGAAITRYVDKEDGAEYVYSLFVPSDASTAFPVFDQPDLKARFNLLLQTPKGWKVISNSDTSRIQTLPFRQDNFYTTQFEETKPISTYVFAFAAGDFVEFEDETETEKEVEKADKMERAKLTEKGLIVDPSFSKLLEADAKARTKIYVRKSQAEKFKQYATEVFRLNREGVKFLESWFDYKFPFPKYDLVLIPEFPFGGMEHAGATFLREDRVIFPTEPTKNDYITRANVIFHEAAHQWFGDTVTMRWFDDLWLKEGFAEFMAYKTLEKVMPEYNAWKIFYERNKQLAYLTDSTRGTTPIYQEIPNLSAAKSAYGNIVYRKAPSFLKQAEFYLGADKFQTAVRAFLKKHEFANAEWTDLVKEFETASKQDLKDWGNVWIKNRGLEIYKVTFNPSDKETSPLNVKIKNNFDRDFSIAQKLNMLWVYKDGVKETKSLEVSSKTSEFKFQLDYPYEKEQFAYFFPNYQDYGYGIFLLDEKSRAYVLANIQMEKDDFLRALMWGSLWDSVRETELAPKDYVELVIKNINVETDESTIQTLLARVSTAMNYYLTDKQHEEFATKLETLLVEKMSKSETLGQRITFYRAFLNIASSEKARNVLKEMLKQSVSNPTVKENSDSGKQEKPALTLPTLRTKDKFDIVTRLLILGDKDAPQILAELEKAETSDEAKRYAYAAKAGIATAENKLKFWNDFVTNKEISESRIESAFISFNSPKHSDFTLPYLAKALNELPNLKRNRKIFFVNGWLAAFIGGQKSEQALAIVNKFLADNPNLDKDLRLKILENSDNFERSLKIRRKFAIGD